MNHLNIHAAAPTTAPASVPDIQARNTQTPDHRPPSPVRQFTLLLSSTRRGARLARLLAVQQLIDWNVPFEAPAQIVAELASNAATHGRVAGRDFRLTLTPHGVISAGADDRGTLRMAVTDARGKSHPYVARSDAPDAESGCGLLLVAAFADRWGVQDGPSPCKTVWAEIDTRG